MQLIQFLKKLNGQHCLIFCLENVKIVYYRLPPLALDNDNYLEKYFMVTLVPTYVVTFHRKFKSLTSQPITEMEILLSTTPKTDLVHPEDAQYIWLPFAVLVGVFVLAGLVN